MPISTAPADAHPEADAPPESGRAERPPSGPSETSSAAASRPRQPRRTPLGRQGAAPPAPAAEAPSGPSAQCREVTLPPSAWQEWPWIPDKHLVLLGDELFHLTPLPGRRHLARWRSGDQERVQEVPTSLAAMRFPALVAFPGLIENLFDDHLPDGSVRAWEGQIDYGQSIPMESDLAGVLSICTRLVLREQWPGSPMRVRAAELALDWAEDPGLIPELSLPERSQASATWHRQVMQLAASRLLNGRTERDVAAALSDATGENAAPESEDLDDPLGAPGAAFSAAAPGPERRLIRRGAGPRAPLQVTAPYGLPDQDPPPSPARPGARHEDDTPSPLAVGQ